MISKPTIAIVLATALVAGAAGCSSRDAHRGAGAVLGGVAGGVLGSTVGSGSGRLIATGVGAALGAWAGSEIGEAMSESSKQEHARTTQTALESNESGQTSTWDNPDDDGYASGGSVTPTETYQQDDGTYCREYQQTITVGGETKQGYGTACRQPDGTWKIVDSH